MLCLLGRFAGPYYNGAEKQGGTLIFLYKVVFHIQRGSLTVIVVVIIQQQQQEVYFW